MPDYLPDLEALLYSWELTMRSEGKAAPTVKLYRNGITLFLRWCDETGIPRDLNKTNAQGFLAHTLETRSSGTAIARYKAVTQFAKWLEREGEIPSNPLASLRQPSGQRKVVNVLDDEQVRAMIAACKGPSLRARRDEAIIRFMNETGVRAAELLNMERPDIDLAKGVAVITRGKGGKGRIVPFGPKTAAAIDKYFRTVRREGRYTETGPVWVSARGKSFGYHGLNDTMKRRAEAAGVSNFHLHRMRHTMANRWLEKGGSEQGLMSTAGWSSRAMLDRYTRTTMATRAAEEARGLDLGDV
jgi:site-specific recombinase XerD